jgi:hypothetical protein
MAQESRRDRTSVLAIDLGCLDGVGRTFKRDPRLFEMDKLLPWLGGRATWPFQNHKSAVSGAFNGRCI